MNIRLSTMSLVAVAALALSACGSDGTPNAPAESAITVSASPTSAPSTPTVAPSTPTDSSGAAGGTEQNIDDHNAWVFAAIETAETATGGAAVSVDENDDFAWEVDVVVGDRVVEVKVSRDGTEVLFTEDDDRDAAERAAAGDLRKALEAALAHTPGAIDDAELDDDGGLHWEVELDRTANGDDVELRVDAQTFAVTLSD